MSTTLQREYSQFFVEQSPALSEGARTLAGFFSKISAGFRRSVSLGRAKEKADEELYQVFTEACEPGWDGYGAPRASFESYLKARKFIEALPPTIPVPDVAIEPDGQVAFEWHAGPRRAFSVSIGDNEDLAYAGIKGPNKFHGTETFHDIIPKTVLDLLFRVLN